MLYSKMMEFIWAKLIHLSNSDYLAHVSYFFHRFLGQMGELAEL